MAEGRAGGAGRGGVDRVDSGAGRGGLGGEPGCRLPGRLPFIRASAPPASHRHRRRSQVSRQRSGGPRRCGSLARRGRSRHARSRGGAGPACVEPRPGPGPGPRPQVGTPLGRHVLWPPGFQRHLLPGLAQPRCPCAHTWFPPPASGHVEKVPRHAGRQSSARGRPALEEGSGRGWGRGGVAGEPGPGSHSRRGAWGCNQSAGWKGKRLWITPGFHLGVDVPRGGKWASSGSPVQLLLDPGALESSKGGQRAGLAP